MIETVNNVMPCRTMPQAHQAHRDDIADIRGSVTILEPFIFQRCEDEAIVNVITELERQAHMPAIPKVADVARKERAIEVFGRVYAEQITESDCEGAVAGEVKE
jgi:hypothetical protein